MVLCVCVVNDFSFFLGNFIINLQYIFFIFVGYVYYEYDVYTKLLELSTFAFLT